MANGYFERGEIYQVRADDGFGCETGVFRPGIIVSNDLGNKTSPTVLVAYLTTKDHKERLNYETYATGRRSFVLCNQIITVDKRRLGSLMGVLNQAEMREVDDRLEEVFDLGYTDDTALKEKDREIEARDAVIAEKDAKIAALKALVAELKTTAENAELAFKVESAMWQKLYEKALNQVVDMKYTNDLFLKGHLGRDSEAPKPVEVPKVPEPPKPPVEPVVEVEADERLDINHCTITALRRLGFGLPMAKKIVDGRPYNAVSDLKNGLGMKATQYRIMEQKLRCTPIIKEPEKTTEPLDLSSEVELEAPATPTKVNVNTASAKEIAEKTGMSMTVAYGIVGKRKREGAYKNLEDLLNPPRFTQNHLDRYRDNLEV